MGWWRSTERSFRARHGRVFALVLGLVACGGESMRRDGVETEGDGGTTSAGGTAGASAGGNGSGATSGVSGTMGSGGARCDLLRAEYAVALSRAKSCDPAQSSPRCEHVYAASLPCGCPTFANESPELETYRAEWHALGCPQPPCPTCDSPMGAYCSESGRCEDVWAPPRCDGLLGTPSPVCDYGVSCTDAASCVHEDCYVPGSRQNPVCSRRCNTANDCPIGTACVEVGGDGSHCFVRCTDDELCRSINAAPENPLACVSFGVERVCIQASEP